MTQPSLFDDLPTDEPSETTTAPAPPDGGTAPVVAAEPPRDPSRPLLLALDGNSLAHRAFHAYGRAELTAPSDGRPVFAVYGFFALLAGIADITSPDAIVVGFDSRVSNRKQRWPHYKANRSAADQTLYDQMNEIQQVLEELGIYVEVTEGWEADDVVASAATHATERGWDTVVATSDRDSFALISPTVTVLRLASGLANAKRMTPEMLVAEYGVTPEQYPQFAALRGDPSDNLPGVKGVGAKTAVKLLAGLDVESAIADVEAATALVGPAAASKIAASADAYRHNLEVMRLIRDLEVDLDRAALDTHPNQVTAVLDNHEIRGVSSRLIAAIAKVPHGDQPEPDFADVPDPTEEPF